MWFIQCQTNLFRFVLTKLISFQQHSVSSDITLTPPWCLFVNKISFQLDILTHSPCLLMFYHSSRLVLVIYYLSSMYFYQHKFPVSLPPIIDSLVHIRYVCQSLNQYRKLTSSKLNQYSLDNPVSPFLLRTRSLICYNLASSNPVTHLCFINFSCHVHRFISN